MKRRNNRSVGLNLKRFEIATLIVLAVMLLYPLVSHALTIAPWPPGDTDDYPTNPTPENYCPNLTITMQRGARDATTGGQVSELQAFLANYFDIDEEALVTGYFGRLTQGHVIRFQQQHGLPAYGIVGSMTRVKIAQVCGGTVPLPQPIASLSASPASGPAPLTVYFQGSGPALTQSAGISFGDGTMTPEGVTNVSHTYDYPGTYKALLHKDGAKGEVVGTATITVTGRPENGRSINVLTPIAGSSVAQGQTLRISWASQKPSRSMAVALWLVNPGNGNVFTLITTTRETTGSYDWQVPETICEQDMCGIPLYPGDYQIAATLYSPYNAYIYGFPPANPIRATVHAKGNTGVFTITAPGPTPDITVTAPNGGEEWEAETMNTITWAPYGYNPDINPSRDVMGYLMTDPSGADAYVVGEIVPSGKASIHWEGLVRNVKQGDFSAPPGKYWIKIINKKTGASDTSDASFTITPKSVDLKLAESDGPISLGAGGAVAARWTSTGATSCELHNAVLQSNPNLYPAQLSTSGSAIIIPSQHVGAVTIMCTKEDGTRVFDSVTINIAPTAASVGITSPNGGEQIQWNQPMNIRWTQQGLRSASIALYRNDQWYSWIRKNVTDESFESTNAGVDTFAYSWNPQIADVEVGKNIYKIYITGQKADGSGYVDDKSDAPFSFTRGSGPTKISAAVSPKVAIAGSVVTLRWDINAPKGTALSIELQGGPNGFTYNMMSPHLLDGSTRTFDASEPDRPTMPSHGTETWTSAIAPALLPLKGPLVFTLTDGANNVIERIKVPFQVLPYVTCPQGYVMHNGQCVAVFTPAPAPAPTPTPTPSPEPTPIPSDASSITSITASKTSAYYSDPVTFTWQTANMSKCTLAYPNSQVGVVVNGSKALSFSKSRSDDELGKKATVRLTCYNSANMAFSKSVTISLSRDPDDEDGGGSESYDNDEGSQSFPDRDANAGSNVNLANALSALEVGLTSLLNKLGL